MLAMSSCWLCHHAGYVIMLAMSSCWLCHHAGYVIMLPFSYTRAGCVIMLIHDINDVLMEVAKLCSYMKKEMSAKVAFGLFVVCWMALRMVMFPAVIIRSTMFEVVEVRVVPCLRW
jgi:ceramide synthetase